MFVLVAFVKMFIGVLIGMSLVRWVAWRRFGHHRFHRGHGFGPRRWLWAMRELKLDAQQRSQVKDMVIELKRLGTELRFARFDAREELSAVIGGDTFDRARVEALAQRQQDSLQRTRQVLIDRMEQLHGSLTSEQKARLRELLGGNPPAAQPGEAHPYR